MPKTRGRRSSLGQSSQSRSSTRPTTRSQPDSRTQGQVDASGSQTTSQSQPGAESEEQMPVLSQLLDLIRSEVRREVDQRTTSLPPVTGMVLYLFMYVCRCYILCIICMTVYWCTNLLIEHWGRVWSVGQVDCGQLVIIASSCCRSGACAGHLGPSPASSSMSSLSSITRLAPACQLGILIISFPLQVPAHSHW